VTEKKTEPTPSVALEQLLGTITAGETAVALMESYESIERQYRAALLAGLQPAAAVASTRINP
jgi:hypothetical protein